MMCIEPIVANLTRLVKGQFLYQTGLAFSLSLTDFKTCNIFNHYFLFSVLVKQTCSFELAPFHEPNCAIWFLECKI